jgi:transposase
LAQTVDDLKQAYPDEVVEVWAEDEARLGLKPILRRVWAKRGARPQAVVYPRYEWLWVYAAVHPSSGQVFWAILPYLNTEMMQLFLDEFAMSQAKGKRIVMVLDQATVHRAKALKVPERITIAALPAYSPELNPSERLWPLVKESVANRTQESLDELEQTVCARCQSISKQPAQVTALTNYHWWPTA